MILQNIFQARYILKLSRYYYCIFFLALFAMTSCNNQTLIVDNVPEREANEIVVLLNSKGILAEKIAAPASTMGGGTANAAKSWNITVPAPNITESLAILNQAGLPRIKGTSLLSLFGNQGLVPSDLQDKIRYQEGLSEQLANTIRKMSGIIDANVQITFPQEGANNEMTASVYVKHRGILDNPNSLTIIKIKRLVSSALPGLTIENVTVIADRALLADISLAPSVEAIQQIDYVSLWGIVIAKQSVWQFRLVFYVFLVIIFILICAIGWMIWKFYPIMRAHGSYAFLFKPEPYSIEPPTPSTNEEGNDENEGF